MKKIFFLIMAACFLYGDNGLSQYSEFSLTHPTYDKFLKFVEESGLTEDDLNNAYSDCEASPRNAFICALAYDYGYSTSDLAAAGATDKVKHLYLMAADEDIHIGAKSAKYEYADYMLRNGKSGNIKSFFKPGECYTKMNKGTCFYYLGASRYLDDPKDCKYLRQASRYGIKPNFYKRLCEK